MVLFEVTRVATHSRRLHCLNLESVFYNTFTRYQRTRYIFRECLIAIYRLFTPLEPSEPPRNGLVATRVACHLTHVSVQYDTRATLFVDNL